MDFTPAALKKLSDEELAEALKHVIGNKDLPRRPILTPPVLHPKTPMRLKLHTIQQFIKCFEYNHTGTSYFKKRRDRGSHHVMLTAKEIIREALPIQCVEAVFLALFLTAGMSDLTRFPVSFKSSVDGHVYRHIVLAVVHNGKWGTLGISRRDSLMYKELVFDSLADIVLDFKKSYEHCCHELLKVYMGLPFSHDTHANGPIKWRALRLNLETSPWKENAQALNRFAREGPSLTEYLQRSGDLPEEFQKRTRNVGRGGKQADDDDYSDADDGSDGDNPAGGGHKANDDAPAAAAAAAAAAASPGGQQRKNNQKGNTTASSSSSSNNSSSSNTKKIKSKKRLKQRAFGV